MHERGRSWTESRGLAAGSAAASSLSAGLEAVVAVVAVEHRRSGAGHDPLHVTDQKRLRLLLGRGDLEQVAQLLLARGAL